ncbi:MAG: type II toxin-antitoxin system VapC family toxin [Chloroflexi bacterium]|nr:type II toxin-antitoxin system VapC family toxin [Chloroflexota bacterium]
MATSNSNGQDAKVFDFTSALPFTIYWDANFILNSVYERGRWHAECVAFGTRLDQSETISYVSTLALDEVWFSLLQLLIHDDYPDTSFWRIVNADSSVIKNYINRLEQITNDIYNNPRVRVISVGSRAPLRALKHMREFYLLPRDALHLATMRQRKIKHLVTTDADFLPATGISIYTCNPKLFKR